MSIDIGKVLTDLRTNMEAAFTAEVLEEIAACGQDEAKIQAVLHRALDGAVWEAVTAILYRDRALA